ncbi:MAG: hypothetical protein ABW185_20030 [Sedimenticola sp.]
MKHIKEQRHFLQLFLIASRDQRTQLLNTVSREQLKALTEIAHNVLRYVITLTPTQRSKLKRRQRTIRLLGDPTIGYTLKKKAIVRKGSDILTLLKIVQAHLWQKQQ